MNRRLVRLINLRRWAARVEDDPMAASRPAWDAARRRYPDSVFGGDVYDLALARVAFTEGYAARVREEQSR